MDVGKTIGQHDTGWRDKGKDIKTSKALGENVNAAEALRLTQANKGAELLIEKQDAQGNRTYDVYELAIENNEGKSLKSVDMFDENIEFEKGLAKQFGGTQAIFSPENEKWATPEKDFVTYWNVREDLGKGMEGLKYSATATAVNVASFVSSGKAAVPWKLGQVYMNERFVYQAENEAKAAQANQKINTSADSSMQKLKSLRQNVDILSNDYQKNQAEFEAKQATLKAQLEQEQNKLKALQQSMSELEGPATNQGPLTEDELLQLQKDLAELE